MKFAENEVRQITEETWRLILGEDLARSPQLVNVADIEDSIAACAQIVGDWQLAVVIYCSTATARHAASIMFEIESSEPPLEDIHDCMCELINIISGNVKGVLSGSSRLSLPSLVKGDDFKIMFPRHVLLGEAGFIYRGQPLLVLLLGEDKLESRMAHKVGTDAVS
jgi:CheY-specific phosphatase CheX